MPTNRGLRQTTLLPEMLPITLQLPLRAGEGFEPAGAQPSLRLQELTEFTHCGGPQRLASPIITARRRHVRGSQVVDRSLAAAPEPRALRPV